MTEKEILDKYMENPHWREVYEKAPSDAAKKYFKASFLWSGMAWFKTGTEERMEELHAQMEGLRKRFGKEDWEYLIKNAGGNTAKIAFKEKMKEAGF